MEIELQNQEETGRLAKIIGEVAVSCDVLILAGGLGVGKTTLTKGIAVGLGIEKMIKSPTYTIIREYFDGRIPLYHMDLYRVKNEIDELGLDDYFEADGLSVIEWGKFLGECLPKNYVEITLQKSSEETQRVAKFCSVGSKGSDFYQRIQEKCLDC
ncbi:MAG: tRNA (adenosine(37)-N6)-threonylcarbamoyltransferase complex ATPase subunit type 1 TsaE [Lactobacillales bacterium]|jgi:tRNA threonylcarbamoyladenosine biosynthesis protein TsaE|nr:tRNA (adenosine(37)-N6)-threonylcarbamoyltransferase complex ATPase subunit type 1 TsaE [Lactobacillales bacterium]